MMSRGYLRLWIGESGSRAVHHALRRSPASNDCGACVQHTSWPGACLTCVRPRNAFLARFSLLPHALARSGHDRDAGHRLRERGRRGGGDQTPTGRTLPSTPRTTRRARTTRRSPRSSPRSRGRSSATRARPTCRTSSTPTRRRTSRSCRGRSTATCMIDRLVYPTLGNPNLYTKNDPNDQFMAVLRIEDAAFAHLGLKPEADRRLVALAPPDRQRRRDRLRVLPRAARRAREQHASRRSPIISGNGTGVVRIYPNEVLVNPIPADMPAVAQEAEDAPLRLQAGRDAARPRRPLRRAHGGPERQRALQARRQPIGIYEYQYNAVRVFDTEPDEYTVLNVTDTQVSVGDLYGAKTKDKLDEFVHFLNTTSDPNVLNASFITFNGDLHNGGSPASLRQRTVAPTYNDEAKAIVNALKYLPVPIFLTAGNHDGYVSTGHVPGAVKALDTALVDSLPEVINEASPKAWPDFAITKFQAYIAKTEQADQLGGLHQDIFTGTFSRTAQGHGLRATSWKEVPRDDRNFILYDGFHQWQKTYGPLYFSWKFGKSFYVSLNSFELRQHRRTGWGMYTVNYGGGMSDVQIEWLDRELLRSKVDRRRRRPPRAPRPARRPQEQGPRLLLRAARVPERVPERDQLPGRQGLELRGLQAAAVGALARPERELRARRPPGVDAPRRGARLRVGRAHERLLRQGAVRSGHGLAPLLLQRRRADEARRAEPAGPHDAARAHALQPARGAPERRRAAARAAPDRRGRRADVRDARGAEPDPRVLVRPDGDGPPRRVRHAAPPDGRGHGEERALRAR